jgi:hypothetical protein
VPVQIDEGKGWIDHFEDCYFSVLPLPEECVKLRPEAQLI